MLKEQDGRLKSSQLVLLTSLEPTKREEKKEVIFKKTSVNSENGDNHLTFPNAKYVTYQNRHLGKLISNLTYGNILRRFINYD